MDEWKYRLGDLAGRNERGRADENAYSAMVGLLGGRFLHLTARERARQVHRGPACRPVCGICQDIMLRHAQWATDKLNGHLRCGPPTTKGVVVRDWVTILGWITSPDLCETTIARVRDALGRRLPEDDPLLPLTLAVSTQLLPSLHDARGPRSMRDYVGDWRKSVLAQRQGWAVKPDRDLASAVRFEAVRERHPRGTDLLVEVIKRLEWGDDDPYRTVLGRPTTRPGDQAALRSLLADLLSAEPTRSWFLRNVDARHSYNQDLTRRTYRSPDVELLGDDGDRLDEERADGHREDRRRDDTDEDGGR